MKEAVLEFALLAAGAAGASFDEFGRWLSPWGWHRGSLAPLLLSMRERGLAHLEEGPTGEILRLRLTEEGEQAFAVGAQRRRGCRAGGVRGLPASPRTQPLAAPSGSFAPVQKR